MTSGIFWNLESGFRNSGIALELADFWPISMYWVYFPLNFYHWTWFSGQNLKITFFSGIWNLESWNSGITLELAGFWPISKYWVFFLLNFYHWICFSGQNLKITFFSGIWNLEFWNSVFTLELAVFLTNFNVLGIFSTQFLSLNLIFSSDLKIQLFLESGIWNSWVLELPWNWLIFDQFQCVGYFPHSVFVTEFDFQPTI